VPNFQGVWNLSEQYQAIGSQNWPMAPGAPTGVSASAGDSEATVSFTAPTFQGVPPNIIEYLVTSDPGAITETGSASPITVTGLSNGTSYTFAVQATNGVQFGLAGVSGGVTPAPARGLFGGGNTGSRINVIEYITMASAGNTTDFGDLATGRDRLSGGGSSTRGVFAGGETGPDVNTIEFVTIASTGNAAEFGDLTRVGRLMNSGQTGSDTRTLFGGGLGAAGNNTIEYITTATTGNAIDFGDRTVTGYELGGCSSPTRSLFAGGVNSGNVIDFVTTATTGNASDFGDLSGLTPTKLTGASSQTRGLFAGGDNLSVIINTIQYVTMASAGNTTDFGDLTLARAELASVSSSIRAVFAGGTTGSLSDILDYVTISSTGNASNFGDLSAAKINMAGCSAAHGGLA
jgi:hypothetical protein